MAVVASITMYTRHPSLCCLTSLGIIALWLPSLPRLARPISTPYRTAFGVTVCAYFKNSASLLATHICLVWSEVPKWTAAGATIGNGLPVESLTVQTLGFYGLTRTDTPLLIDDPKEKAVIL
jgi:hypothetical protein